LPPANSFSPPTCLDKVDSMVCGDGMPIMTHRTTFALDEATAQRLKRLAARWDVSQAEVVRRSVEQAENLKPAETPDPAAMLRALFASGGGLDLEKGNAYIAEVYEDRKHWRGE
jgi:predicted transcriptional regulator